jgi:hypothetical protein
MNLLVLSLRFVPLVALIDRCIAGALPPFLFTTPSFARFLAT